MALPNGMKHGEYRKYEESRNTDRLIRRSWYHKGEQDTLIERYDHAGRMISVEQLENGLKHGYAVHYKDRNVFRTYDSFTSYYVNGACMFIVPWNHQNDADSRAYAVRVIEAAKSVL